MTLILASGSATRAAMLTQAGLLFERVRPDVDERAVEASLNDTGLGADDVAAVLAEVKAVQVSNLRPDDLVIGADQTLALGDERLHKPADMDAARRQLLAMSGRTHQLHSAVVVAKAGTVLFRTVSSANLTMRPFTPAFVGHYLAVSATRRYPASAPIRSKAGASSSSRRSRAITSPSSACPCCRFSASSANGV